MAEDDANERAKVDDVSDGVRTSALSGESEANWTFGYSALFLSAETSAVLRSVFPCRHPACADALHVTLKYRPAAHDLEGILPLIGSSFELRVLEEVHDEKGQALRVELPAVLAGECKNVHAHVTLSTALGTSAVYSNEMLERQHEQPSSVAAVAPPDWLAVAESTVGVMVLLLLPDGCERKEVWTSRVKLAPLVAPSEPVLSRPSSPAPATRGTKEGGGESDDERDVNESDESDDDESDESDDDEEASLRRMAGAHVARQIKAGVASPPRKGGQEVAVCRFFLQGRCRHGDHCRFGHPYERSGGAAHPISGPPACTFFAKGTCREGDKCRFAHYPAPCASDLPLPPSPAIASAGEEAAEGEYDGGLFYHLSLNEALSSVRGRARVLQRLCDALSVPSSDVAPSDDGRLVVIMRGLPGSGKSTINRRLHDAWCIAYGTGVAVCSADAFFEGGAGLSRRRIATLARARGAPESTYRLVFDPKKLGLAHAQCRNHFEAGLREGRGLLIVDNTNTTLDEYAYYRRTATRAGWSVVVVEVLGRSWEGGSVDHLHARNTHGVPLDTVKAMYARWQPDVQPSSIVVRLRPPGLASSSYGGS
jgi:hypothetical protein